MGLVFPLVVRCISYIKNYRNNQIKTLRIFVIMNIIVFSPIIILFYFNFNSIICKTSNKSESNANNFIFQVPLDSNNRFRLFWTIDYESEFVTLEVRSTLENKNDWFAIGFSDYGQITNADLCILWFDKKNRIHFQVIIKINSTIIYSIIL
jgi:hypothetical protein